MERNVGVAVLLLLVAGCMSSRRSGDAIVVRRDDTLAVFTVRDDIGHHFVDELVHFDFDVADTTEPLVLTDRTGTPLVTQITDMRRAGGRLSGRAWTVTSVERRGATVIQLRVARRAGLSQGAQRQAARPAGVTVVKEGTRLLLGNDRISVALPRWSDVALPVALDAFPAPFDGVREGSGSWLTDASWTHGQRPRKVVEAHTRVVEDGPVRGVVQQQLVLDDGSSYTATLRLAASQDAAVIVEDSDVDDPSTALRVSMHAGLAADRVYWQSQWSSSERHGTWALFDTKAPPSTSEQVICKLRPWSFWWLPDLAEWAGFYHAGDEPFVGVIMLRPSKWSPDGWEGFERTEVPVTLDARGLALSFKLAADRHHTPSAHPLHREWAVSVGKVSQNVSTDPSLAKLRHQLVKLGEFPLDELKSYGFERSRDDRPTHKRLLFTAPDIARVRRLALSEPHVRAKTEAALRYLEGCGGLQTTLEREGAGAFYKRYVGHQLQEALPVAFLGSGDPIYAKFMGAAVMGLARTVVETFVESPPRPALGAYGPWFSETVTRLLLHYDLIADSSILSTEEDDEVRRILIFAAHVLDHPDYWSRPQGLASGNPNMSSSILLIKGLLGLALPEHSRSAAWLSAAEDELKSELTDWVSPGGAWIESPFYQVSSLDGMFLLAHALRNVTGRNYFSHPRFRETMDYFGSLVTPPDPRFSLADGTNSSPMTVPSIGNAFAGTVTPYNGWMAASTALDDPAYSAQQQFFWRGQNYAYDNAWRAVGMVIGTTDPTLPARAPTQTSRAFPGFGSVSRSSWLDPRASYVAHRTGPNGHHYDHDQGSFVYYAKGAPLCLDWGNLYQPVTRSESYYHNLVSFDLKESAEHFAVGEGRLVDFRSLPDTLDYSHGEHSGSGGQHSSRHLLLIKSAAPRGATYLLARDTTGANSIDQAFYWNLWCLATSVEQRSNIIHFAGQFEVDLDLHVLSPAQPKVEVDQWSWTQTIYTWKDFREEQQGVHIAKVGSREDFFMLLNPRARSQRASKVEAFGGGAAAAILHDEGEDFVLLSPGKVTTARQNEVVLSGEIAFARRSAREGLRLAVVLGASSARLGGFALQSSGPVSISVAKKTLVGESSGAPHRATIGIPRGVQVARAAIGGSPLPFSMDRGQIVVDLPAGEQRFELTLR